MRLSESTTDNAFFRLRILQIEIIFERFGLVRNVSQELIFISWILIRNPQMRYHRKGTDDQDTMSYLNAWDKQIRSCDVVDDYASEREDIQRVQGRNFAFSFGNYICGQSACRSHRSRV